MLEIISAFVVSGLAGAVTGILSIPATRLAEIITKTSDEDAITEFRFEQLSSPFKPFLQKAISRSTRAFQIIGSFLLIAAIGLLIAAIGSSAIFAFLRQLF